MRKCRQRKTISVAAVQPAMVEEIDAQRLARVERLLAGVEKADMVLLPELWRVGYSNFPAYSKKAETIDGGTVSFLSGAAKQLGAYLLGGKHRRTAWGDSPQHRRTFRSYGGAN